MFKIHPQLAKDCVVVAELAVSSVLLSKDANYPWYILVPRIEAARELHHLGRDIQHQIYTESAQLAAAIDKLHSPDKLNIAALGNMVAQLHIHHIGRYEQDVAWPAPVWGRVDPAQYSTELLQQRVEEMAAELA